MLETWGHDNETSCSHGLSSYQVSFLIVKGMPSRSFLFEVVWRMVIDKCGVMLNCVVMSPSCGKVSSHT